MGYFRVHASGNFTIINNHIFRNKNLSWKAKGILAQMLSLPEDWDYTEAGLKSLAKDGITATRSALKELEEQGYLKRSKVRDEHGKIIDIAYDIYEEPVANTVPYLDDQGVIEDVKSDPSREDKQPFSENPKVDEPFLGSPKLDFPFLDFESNKKLNNKILNNQGLNHHPQKSENPVWDNQPEDPDDDDISTLLEKLDFQNIMSGYRSQTVKTIRSAISGMMDGKPIRVASTMISPSEAKGICMSLKGDDLVYAANALEDPELSISNRVSYVRTVFYNRTRPKKEPSGTKKYDMCSRNYDWDKLEAMLLGNTAGDDVS